MAQTQPAKTHTDPVCNMQVSPKDAAATSSFHGSMYYFCSQECHDAFMKNPSQYTTEPEKKAG